jgi:4-hydroxy-3-polyprenylbenzoate decarboxylase
MEQARQIWEELELPPLNPKAPWFGYSLGDWDEELQDEAEAALRGDFEIAGEKLKSRRIKA